MTEKFSSARVWFEGPRNNKQNSKYNGPIEIIPGGYVNLKNRGLILPPHRVIEITDKTVQTKD